MSQVQYYGEAWTARGTRHQIRVLVGRVPGDAEWEAAADDLDYSIPRPAQFVGQKIAWLPHSCQEWIIGGPNEVRAMMADLQKALDEMEKP